MSRLIGWIIFNLLHRDKGCSSPCTIHTHTHKHYSLAGILTLSGDEVVGSMVALKEKRAMTCWVSHLCLRHSCMEGVSLCHPFPSLRLCFLLSYWPTLCNGELYFLYNFPALSGLLLTLDHLFALWDSTESLEQLRQHMVNAAVSTNCWWISRKSDSDSADWTMTESLWQFDRMLSHSDESIFIEDALCTISWDDEFTNQNQVLFLQKTSSLNSSAQVKWVK